MRKYLPRGFTMIELLIVIAVLGVLAIAVLSAINPIEQINRGRDTGSRSDSEQLLSAIDRYNASQMLWPWQNISTDTPIVTWGQVTKTYPPAVAGCKMLQNLAKDDTPGVACPGTDEIKQTFVDRITDARANALWIKYDGGPGDSVYVCFNPQSGSFAQEADRRCDAIAASGAPGDYPAAACGTCPTTSQGKHINCICLP